MMMNPILWLILTVLDIYFWVVLAAVVMSWLIAFNVINGANPYVRQAGHALRRLTEPPDKGKANAAVIAILAKAAGLPKSALVLVSGETDRHKVLLVSGNVSKLEALIAAFDDGMGKDDGETD